MATCYTFPNTWHKFENAFEAATFKLSGLPRRYLLMRDELDAMRKARDLALQGLAEVGQKRPTEVLERAGWSQAKNSCLQRQCCPKHCSAEGSSVQGGVVQGRPPGQEIDV